MQNNVSICECCAKHIVHTCNLTYLLFSTHIHLPYDYLPSLQGRSTSRPYKGGTDSTLAGSRWSPTKNPSNGGSTLRRSDLAVHLEDWAGEDHF
jgi:hypothetical protein